MRSTVLAVLLLAALRGAMAALPLPGSPERLVDWRWLARAPEGQRTTLVGQDALVASAGKYLLLEVNGAGVLDHLILNDPTATLTITVDNSLLWRGTVNTLVNPPAGNTPLFPAPVVCSGANFFHLLAPVGFHTSLRILTDKLNPWRYVSYRTFREPVAVMPADATSTSAYAQGLQTAAADWNVPKPGFHGTAVPPAHELSAAFTAGAGTNITALNISGGGEITHLEFQVIPPLTGSLRELVVELYYDGARAPSLRVPLTDLVGMPHPWTSGRWDTLAGTLAGGIRYPTHAENYTVRLEHALYYCNLPIPFATGLRLDLVNRSTRLAFHGVIRAVVAPAPEGQRAGRLCGTRLIAPIAGNIPFITLPGPGQLAHISLFCTGNTSATPSDQHGASWLSLDGAPPLISPAIVPLWQAYPWQSTPIWMHPRMETQYVGATRTFLTDPLPFEREAAFGYQPGPSGDLTGAPTSATVVALWYRFSDVPYMAPALPAHAEALPYPALGVPSPMKGAQVAAAFEAEGLAPLATAHGGEVTAVEDTEHNYHASGGKYLTIRVDKLNDYTDVVLPFPASRYFVIGTVGLTGPVNGAYHANFELMALARQAALSPPSVISTGVDNAWSVLGGVPMNLPVFVLGTLGYRRDSSGSHTGPVFNPAPDSDGVLRYICRGPGATMLRFDQIWLFTPPPSAPGWQEYEDGPLPDCHGDLTAVLPSIGRLEWSGWGAMKLTATKGGTATLIGLNLTGPVQPRELRLIGNLAPGEGNWQIAIPGNTAPPITLTPGKDANQVMEWKIPISDQTPPGPVTMTITYRPSTGMDQGTPQKSSTLSLDAWTVQ
ncbi:MAG: DUF2961 domain-containing protein [Armatimonadota bacterium]